jgi:hypothetical protein
MEITRDKVAEKIDFWMGVVMGAVGGIVVGAMIHAVAEPALEDDLPGTHQLEVRSGKKAIA